MPAQREKSRQLSETSKSNNSLDELDTPDDQLVTKSRQSSQENTFVHSNNSSCFSDDQVIYVIKSASRVDESQITLCISSSDRSNKNYYEEILTLITSQEAMDQLHKASAPDALTIESTTPENAEPTIAKLTSDSYFSTKNAVIATTVVPSAGAIAYIAHKYKK